MEESPIHRMFRHAEEEKLREQDARARDRGVLFENETLVIKLLQAVSGASLIGALTQADTLIRLAGHLSFLIFLTAVGTGLLAAVFAAHWKHQYQLYNVEGSVVQDEGQARKLNLLRYRYLRGMRGAIWAALLLVVGGFVQLLAFLWILAIQTGRI